MGGRSKSEVLEEYSLRSLSKGMSSGARRKMVWLENTQAGEVSHKVEELKGKLCRKSELTFEALGDAILYENPEMYEELNALHTQKKEDRDGGWASASKSGHDVLAEWLHPG